MYSDKFVFTVWRLFYLYPGVVHKYGDMHFKRHKQMCHRFRDFIKLKKKMQITYKTLPPCCRKAPVTVVFSSGDRDTNLKPKKELHEAQRFSVFAG